MGEIPEEHRHLVEGPPARRCPWHPGYWAHVLVIEYHDREDYQVALSSCVRCLLRNGPRRPTAVWDGDRWETDDPESAWRDAWCHAHRIDPSFGRACWQQITRHVAAAGLTPSWFGYEDTHAWVFLIRNPDVAASTAVDAIRAGFGLRACREAAMKGSASDLDAVLHRLGDDARRGESYGRAVWAELDDDVRGRIIAVGPNPGIDDCREFPPHLVQRFIEVADRVQRGQNVPWHVMHPRARLEGWNPDTIDQIRLVSEWLTQSGAVPGEAARRASRDRYPRRPFGPNSDAVEELLNDEKAFDSATKLCLHLATREGDLDSSDHNRLDRTLMVTAGRLLMLEDYIALQEGTLHMMKAERRVFGGHLIWTTAVQFAGTAYIMRGFVEPAAADSWTRPYRRALAAAEQLRTDPDLEQAAWALAKEWVHGRLEDFLEESRRRRDRGQSL